jgi:minor extracellular serine protease Vpr
MGLNYTIWGFIKMRITHIAAVVLASIAGASTASAKDVSDFKKLDVFPEIIDIKSFAEEKIKNEVTQDFYYIVRLGQQPLATKFNQSNNKKGNLVNIYSNEAKAHLALLKQERATFKSTLAKHMPHVKAERHYDTVINAVVVKSKKDVFQDLVSLPGVTKVFKHEMYQASMDASNALINATQVWEQMGGKENAGKGVKVAVIDTGIRPEHPMFADDSGFEIPAVRPSNDYCAEVPSFCNNKLIAARYAMPTFAQPSYEHLSPLGYGSHGTHVAGTAVGNHVTTNYQGVELEMSGVAPGAYLMAYKGLFGGSGSNVMLLEMLDWAVKDGADVINNSWGRGAGGDPANSVYTEAFQNAEDAGVVVVSAAGNSGPGAQTVGCPGCIESGLTVASTFHGRFFAQSLSFEGLDSMMALPSGETSIETDFSGDLLYAGSVDEENVYACNAYAADSFKDKIALVSRGGCTFTSKVTNAAAAGATGVVVHNNIVGAPLTMFVEGTTVPSFMVSKPDGESLIAAITDENSMVSVSAEKVSIVDASSVDTMSGFSSRGPNGDNNVLKPDIAAPGSSILSALSPDDSGGLEYGTLSGTSMASPHVAGAAAIMKQMYPEWSATDIKTALTSTSKNTGVLKEDYVTPVDPFDVGAGRLDLATSTKAALVFDKPSMAQNPCVSSCGFALNMQNKTATTATWTATVSFEQAGINASVSPASVTLEAMQEAEFSVAVNASESESEGWAFGTVTWTDSSGTYPAAHLPIAVSVNNSTLSSSLIGNAMLGDEVAMMSRISNTGNAFDKQVTMKVKAPSDAVIVDGSESVVLDNASQIAMDLDVNANQLLWTGYLGASEFNLATFAAPLPSISTFVAPLSCSGECDETGIDISLASLGMSFEFNGSKYNAITISDNGIALVGGGNPSGSWNNQSLPSSATPNNVLAPLWADFDLNGSANTSGGGDLYLGIFDLGGTNYLAIEWNKAQLWNDVDAKEYTFQIWIGLGEEQDIFYQYLDLNATLPSAATVGAENASGDIGAMMYYNGGGTAPSNGLALAILNTLPGSVEMNYSLLIEGVLNLGVEDTVSVAEDGSASVNVVENDRTSENRTVELTMEHGSDTYYSTKTIPVQSAAALDYSTIAIVSAPENGSVIINTEDNTLTYSPNADFNGTDSFTYDYADESGARIKATPVSVSVSSINDAPTLLASSTSVSVDEGEDVSLSVTGSDVEGDDIYYIWTQTSGTSAGASSSTNTLSFEAPKVKADETLAFSVVATDGDLSSEPVTISVLVNNKKSSGSMGLFLLLLLPFAIRRKFKG